MVEYYDMVLGGIAGSLLGGILLGLLTPIQFATGVLFGAVMALLFVLDATVRNPPAPEEAVTP